MKLKKIASLALAGLMAVSMLAGCGDNANSGNTNNNGAVSSSIVDAVNNGQDSYNDVKVTFTSDSNIENAAKLAFSAYGENVSSNLSAIESDFAQYAKLLDTVSTIKSNFYGNKTDLKDPTNVAKDGEKVTYVSIQTLGSSSASEAYLMNSAANEINSLVAQLDDTTLVTVDDDNQNFTKEDDPYYDFSYTGKICMVEVPHASGATNYYMVVVLEQTVAEKTL